MVLFKPYTSIKDFLNRFTLFKIGTLHIRIHKISSADRSTLYHNHPFHYISIILKGGYTESYVCSKTNTIKKVTHKLFSCILRKNTVFHRIETLLGETITLFVAYGNYGWKAYNIEKNHTNDGIFQREVNGKTVWSKKSDGIWYIGNINKDIALNETRHSIHQI